MATAATAVSRSGGPLDVPPLVQQAYQVQTWDELFEKAHLRIYRLCYRMMNGNIALAEELAQESKLQIWRKAATFRGDSEFTTWFHRLVVNVVLMHVRKMVKQPEQLSLGKLDELANRRFLRKPIPVHDKVLEQSANRKIIADAVEQLPPGYRIVFILHDVEGFEHNEIAEMMGCTIGNCKSQLHKARLKLRELIRPGVSKYSPYRIQ